MPTALRCTCRWLAGRRHKVLGSYHRCDKTRSALNFTPPLLLQPVAQQHSSCGCATVRDIWGGTADRSLFVAALEFHQLDLGIPVGHLQLLHCRQHLHLEPARPGYPAGLQPESCLLRSALRRQRKLLCLVRLHCSAASAMLHYCLQSWIAGMRSAFVSLPARAPSCSPAHSACRAQDMGMDIDNYTNSNVQVEDRPRFHLLVTGLRQWCYALTSLPAALIVSSLAPPLSTLAPGTALTGGSPYSTPSAATAAACLTTCKADTNCSGWCVGRAQCVSSRKGLPV